MGLVEVVQHFRPTCQHVQFDNFRRMVTTKTLGGLQSKGRLVVARVFKADAEGLDRLIDMARHHADDGARINPAREEGAKRHVGAQPDAATDHGVGVLGRMRTAMDRAAQALVGSAGLLTEDAVSAAVTRIARARRVLVVANGLSSPLASDLAMRLTAVGRPAEIVADPIAQQISARQLAGDDMCLVISGSGANEASVRAARAARAAGAGVLLVTSFVASTLTEIADLSLVLAPAGATFRKDCNV